MGRLTEKDVERILELNGQGVSNRQIAAVLDLGDRHVGETRVAYWLHKRGRKSVRADRAKPAREIARRCGCRFAIYGKSVVVKICLRHMGAVQPAVVSALADLFSLSDTDLPVPDVPDSREAPRKRFKEKPPTQVP